MNVTKFFAILDVKGYTVQYFAKLYIEFLFIAVCKFHFGTFNWAPKPAAGEIFWDFQAFLRIFVQLLPTVAYFTVTIGRMETILSKMEFLGVYYIPHLRRICSTALNQRTAPLEFRLL